MEIRELEDILEPKKDPCDYLKPEGGWKDPIALCAVSYDCLITIIEITNEEEVNPMNLEFIMEDYHNIKDELDSGDDKPGIYYYTLKTWSTTDYFGEHDAGVDYENPVKLEIKK
jgi:hypothetical protein